MTPKVFLVITRFLSLVCMYCTKELSFCAQGPSLEALQLNHSVLQLGLFNDGQLSVLIMLIRRYLTM